MRGCDYKMAGWKIALIVLAAILLLAIILVCLLWKMRGLRQRLCPCLGRSAGSAKIMDSSREAKQAAGHDESHIAINDYGKDEHRVKQELRESEKNLKKDLAGGDNGDTMLNVTQGKRMITKESEEGIDGKFGTVDEECVRDYLREVYEQ